MMKKMKKLRLGETNNSNWLKRIKDIFYIRLNKIEIDDQSIARDCAEWKTNVLESLLVYYS